MGGQVAVLVFVILLALVAAVFLNWDTVVSFIPKASAEGLSFQTYLILIAVAFFAIMFGYAIYSTKKSRGRSSA